MRRRLPAILITSRLTVLLGAITCLTLLGCHSDRISGQAVLPVKDSATFSFGRMNVSMPRPYTVVWNKVVVSDVTVTWKTIPEHSTFAAEAAARDSEIRKLDPGQRKGGPLIRTYNSAQRQGWQFVWEPRTQNLIVEMWQNYGDHILITSTHSYADEIPSAESDIKAILDSFERTDQPVTSGLAVEGGVLHRSFNSNEDIDVTVYLARYPTQAIGSPSTMNFQTTVYTENGRSNLLARASQGQKEMLAEFGNSKDAAVTFQRRGARTVGGMHGAEVFYSGTDTVNHKQLKDANAEFQFAGLANNPMDPLVEIHLSIGPYDTEPDAPLDVWDSVLNSWKTHN